ncbi:MAG: S24 family peptidase [Nitrospirota bacterium]|nr:S24 family peptidase [Nitrospirota bacterium]
MSSMEGRIPKRYSLVNRFLDVDGVVSKWYKDGMEINAVRHQNFLCLIRERCGNVNAEMGRLIEKAPAQIGALVRGERNIGNNIAREIETKLSLPRGWMDISHEEKETEKEFPTHLYAFIPKYQDIRGSGGHGHQNGEHVEISKTLAYRIDWLKSKGLSAENLCVVEVSGDSMSPHIEDGESVLIDMGDTTIRSGEVYAFQSPDGLRIKRFFWQADGRLKISSDNTDKSRFPDESYFESEATQIKIVGRKVWRGG